jgi:hypothetical protein
MVLSMISNDFDVSPVFRDNEASLFAARRPDVWHFVLATTKKLAPNHQSMDIDQFHWPRYCVARALASGRDASMPELIQQLGIHVLGNSLSVTLRGQQYRLPEKLLADMRKDNPILQKAVANVKADTAGFEVSGAVTSRGFSVVAEQRCLAEAIAFERETRECLEPRNFGLYSAFCTWRDFLRDDSTKKNAIATGMAEEMVTWAPDTIGDEMYWESVFQIQERLWGARIWGPGVDAEEDVLLDALSGAFERMSSIQFAQFVLMNGMHRGGPFHALATLFGLIDFDGYKHWRTRNFQPDSPEEQEIRTQGSFIELLGLSDGLGQSSKSAMRHG